MYAALIRAAGRGPEDGLEWLTAGRTVWRDNPELRRLHAELLENGGRYTESLLELEAAIQAQGEDPRLHAKLADVYGRLGLFEQSAEHRMRAEPFQLLSPNEGNK
jgi:hypothetical protein